MNGKLDRADQKERMRWVGILLLMAIAGGAAIVWLLPALTGRLESADPERALKILVITLALLFIPFVLAGLIIMGLARRTLVSGRFPPPGVKVIKDTVVLRGSDARRRGYILMVLGLLLTTLSLYGSLAMPFALHKVFEPKVHSQESN